MADLGMDVQSVHATCPNHARGTAGMPHATRWDVHKAEILSRVFGTEACMAKRNHGLEDIASTYWAMFLTLELARFKKRMVRALESMKRIRADVGTRLKDPNFFTLSGDQLLDAIGEDQVTVPELRALMKKLKDYKVCARYVPQPDDDEDDEDDEENRKESTYGDESQDNDDSETVQADPRAAEARLKMTAAEEARKPDDQKIVEWADLALGGIVGVMEAKSKQRIVTPKQKRTFTKSGTPPPVTTATSRS